MMILVWLLLMTTEYYILYKTKNQTNKHQTLANYNE
jgi:hypothetical protein